MAYPTILIDSASGTDDFASGAGPATAVLVSGTASTDVSGLIVTMPNADLSGVATDGSHAVYIQGQGLRSITATADSGLSTANVTVSTAFSTGLTGQTAAIGGVRYQLFGATKAEYESSLEPGWTVQFAAGHSEYYNGSYFSFNVGDTRTNPITLQGDENSRATFISVVNAFVTHFSFTSSSGLNVKNCNFEGYRGTDTSGTGQVRHVVATGRQSVFINCRVTSRSHYSGNGSWTDTAASTFINCESILPSDATNRYDITAGTGWAGRASSLINCKVDGRWTGVGQQSWEGYMPYITGCHFDCYYGCRFGTVGIYHYGQVLVGNIFKVQPGGIAVNLDVDAWGYGLSGYKMFHHRNIFTSTGSYYGIYINDVQTNTSNLYNNTWFINNVFHNAEDPDPRMPPNQIIDSTNIDPQLSGDLATGRFSVGNEDVINQMNQISGPTGNRPNQAGTQIYPFRHLVEDFFEVHEDATVDGNTDQNFHPLGY
jgi:hypothetical protein